LGILRWIIQMFLFNPYMDNINHSTKFLAIFYFKKTYLFWIILLCIKTHYWFHWCYEFWTPKFINLFSTFKIPLHLFMKAIHFIAHHIYYYFHHFYIYIFKLNTWTFYPNIKVIFLIQIFNLLSSHSIYSLSSWIFI
jgi:hypothetical protein